MADLNLSTIPQVRGQESTEVALSPYAFSDLATSFVGVVGSSAWTAATGTASRSTFATYTAPTISASPTQAEVQAVADAVQALSRHMKALIDDLKAAGVI